MIQPNEAQTAKGNYFDLIKHLKAKLINQDYKIERVSTKVVSLKIDRLFWFNIWVGDTWNLLSLNDTFDGSIVSFPLTDEEKQSLWISLKGLTNEYEITEMEKKLQNLKNN